MKFSKVMYLFRTPRKWWKQNFVEDDLRGGKGRVQTIDKLDWPGARTMEDNHWQMMPMWQRSSGCAMGWLRF